MNFVRDSLTHSPPLIAVCRLQTIVVRLLASHLQLFKYIVIYIHAEACNHLLLLLFLYSSIYFWSIVAFDHIRRIVYVYVLLLEWQ